jgi:UDP-N-acetylglucosamine--N-acetylmuramyl-(pentapeptide) pyrophosphoryl-undecaprenol N-acetylglucosamine transferase
VPQSIVLAGGGTAGHVNPLLAVAQEVRTRYPDARITVLGTEEGLESTLVPAAGFDLRFLPRVPLPRRPSREWFSLIPKLREAISVSKQTLENSNADVVVGFGGYVSTPAYFAARSLKKPIVVQEQNARAGIANKLGARWASAVTTSFASTTLTNSVVTGLPLRADIQQLITERTPDKTFARWNAAQVLGVDPARPVLLVTGGSLGALKLNRTMAVVAPEILSSGVQIIHLTGKGKADEVRATVSQFTEQQQVDYHVLEYLPQMQLAYAVADLVVCRSGAGSVCELAALGIPAVFVPLPIGNGEQRLNASELLAANAALIVDDANFDPEWVRNNVLPLLRDRLKLADMAKAAATVGKPRATAAVVDVIEQIAGWTR